MTHQFLSDHGHITVAVMPGAAQVRAACQAARRDDEPVIFVMQITGGL
jgi:hypothetical protein